MKKAPNMWHLQELPGMPAMVKDFPMCNINGEWVPARPLGYFSLKERFKLAWLVFTGKADALIWPGNQ